MTPVFFLAGALGAEKVGTYQPIFWVAASVYLLGLLAIQLLMPKMAAAKV